MSRAGLQRYASRRHRRAAAWSRPPAPSAPSGRPRSGAPGSAARRRRTRYRVFEGGLGGRSAMHTTEYCCSRTSAMMSDASSAGARVLERDGEARQQACKHLECERVAASVRRVAEHAQRRGAGRRLRHVGRAWGCFGAGGQCHSQRALGQQLARRVDDRLFVLGRELILQPIALGVVQGRDEQRVVDGLGRLGLDVPIDQVCRLAEVAREQPLVVAVLRRQRRRVGHQRRHERQARARACRARPDRPSAASPSAGRADPRARSRTRQPPAARPGRRPRRRHRARFRAPGW